MGLALRSCWGEGTPGGGKRAGHGSGAIGLERMETRLKRPSMRVGIDWRFGVDGGGSVPEQNGGYAALWTPRLLRISIAGVIASLTTRSATLLRETCAEAFLKGSPLCVVA